MLFPSDSKTAAKTIKYRIFLSCDLYRTRGDGNCLYRACSKLLCGKEDLCDLLRDLTSIELFSNQEFYAFMLSIHMSKRNHMYSSQTILRFLPQHLILHWVMGMTGKIPAAG